MRLITLSDLACAALILGVQAALVAGAALGIWPTSTTFRLLNPQHLPAALTAVAMALGLFTAPAFAHTRRRDGGEPTGEDAAATIERRHRLARALFFAAWQAAVLGLFLLVASRLEPVDTLAIVRTMTVLASAVALGILLAARWPSAYAGLVFLWAVALPLSCYLLTEIFLDLPAGAKGWNASRPDGAGFYTLIAASLKASPCTAAVGALKGSLPGLKEFGWSATGLFVAGTSIAAVLIHRWKPRSAPAQHAVASPGI